MTDATTRAHSHAHERAAPAAADRPSILESSALTRLLGVSLAAAVLWVAVYWALQ
jgi:hypothetical protein